MEQVPHVAVHCQENRDVFQNAIPVYILPMVVRYLDDANNQVRFSVMSLNKARIF